MSAPAAEPAPVEPAPAEAAPLAAQRPWWRPLVEALAIAVALTIFCAGGFGGLHQYNASLEAAGHAFIRPETLVDTWIPLRVEWIWPYLTYYPGCFLPVLLLTSMERFRRIALAYAVQFGVAFVFFFALPMRMGQPEVIGASAAEEALRWLYSIDPGYNIFPSLHTANAFMIACAFERLRPWRFNWIFWAWAVSIGASTVLVKQHYALDVVAGLALAWLADRVALRGFRPAHRDTALVGRTPG